MVNNMGPVANKVRVQDADLSAPGQYYYQAQYVIRGEAESVRGDNLGTKRFTPTWVGSWSIVTNDTNITYGSILQRWTGATVDSGTNGNDDGRIYVAVKVSGPTNGLYHYEYAVHNRDNFRGVGAFRIPAPGCSAIVNAGFRDIDTNPANDWTMQQTATEIVFSTTNNPIRWNSFYNFYFDSEAGPVQTQDSFLDEFDAGAGGAFVTVKTTVPGSLNYTSYGTGTAGCDGAHHICGSGAPQVGNANFVLTCDKAPASSLGLGLIGNAKDVAGSDPFTLGILLHLDMFLSTELNGVDFVSDAAGVGAAAAPIPNIPVLAGAKYDAQAIWAWPAAACNPMPSTFGLSSSDAIEITILP
jgi:hypothetical protein